MSSGSRRPQWRPRRPRRAKAAERDRPARIGVRHRRRGRRLACATSATSSSRTGPGVHGGARACPRCGRRSRPPSTPASAPKEFARPHKIGGSTCASGCRREPRLHRRRVRPGQRPHTYHHDGGEVLGAGDMVKVPTRTRGEDGWQRAIVLGTVSQPTFPTKPILGIIETRPPARRARKEPSSNEHVPRPRHPTAPGADGQDLLSTRTPPSSWLPSQRST